MLTRLRYLSVVITLCVLLWPVSHTAIAQNSAAEFQRILQEKAAFEAADLAALQNGQTVVKLLPAQDKREVALSGLVSLRASADDFLRSYRDGMARKNNQAVLEIGRFGAAPALTDLDGLTVETRDIEDLKECVVGDCQLKLSAKMIERFRSEINWQAPDYQLQVTQLLKQMLIDYVRDYLHRGDSALIEYNDKRNEVRLADEHRALSAASGYLNDLLPEPRMKDAGMRLVEEAIVWSKIKFGLKPVLTINHITIYKQDRDSGPQVLAASKQIYANHYFNSSLALTAFVSVPGASPSGYLVYENRSRTDGLQGAFSKLKRGIIENRAVEGLTAILEHSKMSLDGPGASAEVTAASSHRSVSLRQRLFGGIRPVLWGLIISALLTLLVLGRRRAEARPARRPVALTTERR
jgi:hypothetical protein